MQESNLFDEEPRLFSVESNRRERVVLDLLDEMRERNKSSISRHVLYMVVVIDYQNENEICKLGEASIYARGLGREFVELFTLSQERERGLVLRFHEASLLI